MRRALLAASVCVLCSITSNGADDSKKKDKDQKNKGKDAARIEFNRDIRPLLSENCYTCHGPDKAKRKGALRLDEKESAYKPAKSGEIAVIPGNPDKSEIIKRLLSTDPEERMPPGSSGKTLSPKDIETLKAWIKQGAEYQPHWAYITPEKPELPKVKEKKWCISPVDFFVLSKLDNANLKPSVEADKATLIRRLSLDLTGLPPTPSEVEAFVRDKDKKAYERLVDRLLASPQYGERMAVYWLDLVRYADTIGYHSDNPRNVSPYRDYVIQAFNENKPFDQFTIEQLAGDLLPNPTINQKVASAYNRLNMTTEEGGAQAKEYRAKYAADRVRNVSSVWMAATMGCAECHDHKFDPFSTKDFYRLEAFFADVKEADIGRREEGMLVPTPEQEAELKKVESGIADLKKQLESPTPELAAAQAEWEKNPDIEKVPEMSPWEVVGPFKKPTYTEAFKEKFWPERTLKNVDLHKTFDGLKWEQKADWKDETVHNVLNENNAAYYLYRTIQSDRAQSIPLSLGSDDAIVVWLNGKSVLNKDVQRGAAADQEKITLNLVAGKNEIIMKIVNGDGGGGFYFKAGGAGMPKNITDILKIESDKRNDGQKNELAKYFRSISPLLQPLRTQLSEAEAQKTEIEKPIPKTLVSMADKPRVVRVLPRGDWLNETGEEVTPAVPHSLPQIPEKQPRATRLDLANWLVSPENPLTARVFVNRLWKTFFGQGLSKSIEDLGAQGEWPTHPELLDYMAVDFRQNGWDIKRMVKQLVMSSTYRQTSNVTPELRERDPFNRLYARQSRFRLDAEFIRDNALAVSGLLTNKIGGESVKPYQPAGYWQHLNFPTRTWAEDKGENQYRRGLYTFWQRTFLHPSLLAFDATSREECTAERARSNTPQQALVLLNDPTYVEASRVFAERMIKEGGSSLSERLKWAFVKTVARTPKPEELKIQEELFNQHKDDFSKDKDSATKLVSIGQWPVPKDIDAAELAAYTSVARVLLNLHEAVTRY